MSTATSTMPAEIVAIAARGWRLFPVEPKGKKPLLQHWPEVASNSLEQIEAWGQLYQSCNWGLLTGHGLVVIDIDGSEGRAAVLDLELQELKFPDTLTVRTGRADGGEHRYYHVPAGVCVRNNNTGKIGPHIDVRGEGGYVVAPPSVHSSGSRYTYVDLSVPVAELPVWAIERLNIETSICPAPVHTGQQTVGQGSRTNMLVSLAGTMLRRGMSAAAISAALLAENTARCSPPLTEDKVRALACDIVQRYPSGHVTSAEWPKPEPFGSERPPVPAFDPELLPDALRPWCIDIAERMQVPLDYPAVTAVAAMGAAVMRRACIQPKALDATWTECPNLWGAIVGPPGTMKSPVIAAVSAPIRNVEALWNVEFESEVAATRDAKHLAELKERAWEQQYIAASKRGGELPIQPDTSMPEPRRKRLLTSDATFECLHEILAENPAGIACWRDELAGWLASLERQGRETERTFYLEGWSGQSGYTLDRIGRGSIRVEHCCLSVFGGIQPDRLRGYLSDALAGGPSNDGLIQRFGLLVWPDFDGEWTYIDRMHDATAQHIAEAVYQRLLHLDVDNPLRLKFSPDAQQMFVAWLTASERKVRSMDTMPAMQGHLAKYRKLMPALSLLFSLADGHTDAVPLQSAQRAAGWCEYLEPHARRVYASKLAPELAAAHTLARKLTAGWCSEEGFLTLRDVYRPQWMGLTSPDEARAALQVLCEYGWVRKEQIASNGPGRPSEIYRINPKIAEIE